LPIFLYNLFLLKSNNNWNLFHTLKENEKKKFVLNILAVFTTLHTYYYSNSKTTMDGVQMRSLKKRQSFHDEASGNDYLYDDETGGKL